MLNQYNLSKILDEDWFNEVGEPHPFDRDLIEMPDITMDYKIAESLYEPNSLFGHCGMELYKEENAYYLRRWWMEPIGDYGWSSYAQWYKSVNDKEIEKII